MRGTAAAQAACWAKIDDGRRWGAVLFLLAASVFPVDARASYTVEEHEIFLINQTRAAAGAAPLTFDQRLFEIASRWTHTMRDGHFLAHNRNAPAAMSAIGGGWRFWGENVGYGPSMDWIHEQWVASPPHNENLFEPVFTHFSVASAYAADGSVFAVQLFAG